MDEAVIRRIPPHNVEAERAVIGSMMIDAEAVQIGAELLEAEDFYSGSYRELFRILTELYRSQATIDLITLQEKLRKENISAEISGTEFLANLMADVPTSVHVEHYCGIVKEKSVLRKLIRTIEEVSKECYQGHLPFEDILELTEKNIFEILQQRNAEGFEAISQIALKTLEKISLASKKASFITGLRTGFLEIDEKTAGLQKSDLILIAARPAMGKTAFVLNIAEYIAMRGLGNIALFSLEMSKEQIMRRLLSMNAHIDSQKIRTGGLEEKDWECLVESVRNIGKTNLYIDDTAGLTVSEIRTKCRKQKLSGGLDLIIIDYLQLVNGTGNRRNENRQQEISEISRSLKIMARELDVPVVAISQLSRAVEQRLDKRPMLSDLRESGAIEQDADIVMFLYRDDYYNPKTEHLNEAEVIIAKQRNGPTGTVRLAWLPYLTKFSNLERKYQ